MSTLKRLGKPVCNARNAGGARDGDSVGKGRRNLYEEVLVDLVPDRQQDPLVADHLASSETIELMLRPLLLEEGLTQNDYAESRLRQAALDRLAEAIADAQLELVVPHREAAALQHLGERPSNGVLILARMADEEVVGDGCASYQSGSTSRAFSVDIT